MGEIRGCRIIDIPRLQDSRGSLSFVQPPLLPFEIRRVYYLYDVPAEAVRGGHGHRRLEQLMIAVSGSLSVELDDGTSRQEFRLDAPNRGLYIRPMIWRRLRQFSAGTVCLVLASERFDEGDYFHDYGEFLAAVKTTK